MPTLAEVVDAVVGVYTSLAFSKQMTELNLDQSFSGVGSCYDNAAVESFFATVKRPPAWTHPRVALRTARSLDPSSFDAAIYHP